MAGTRLEPNVFTWSLTIWSHLHVESKEKKIKNQKTYARYRERIGGGHKRGRGRGGVRWCGSGAKCRYKIKVLGRNVQHVTVVNNTVLHIQNLLRR